MAKAVYWHCCRIQNKVKNDFEKDFFKLMNNFIFEIIMENVINHRDVKIVTTNRQRNKLVSEQTYHTTKHIPKNLLIIKIKKTEIKMNKPIYLGLSILYISKNTHVQLLV